MSWRPGGRVGSFEPLALPKRQVVVTEELEEKAIGLYGLGLSAHDISKHIKKLYQMDISAGTLSSVTDKVIPAMDGLKGFPGAIATIFPKTGVQTYVIHQIRNRLRYIAEKDKKPFMADPKPVYQALTKEQGYENLIALDGKWGKNIRFRFPPGTLTGKICPPFSSSMPISGR